MSNTVNRAELLKRLSPAQRALLLKELQKEAAQTNGHHDIPRRPQAGPIPLSFNQQRLWFLSQVDPDSPLYNVPEAISLQGQLNVAALEQSLNEIIRRHDALRTVFTIVERQPVQICTPARPLSLKLIDLTHIPPAARELAARRLVETEARRPFNLTNDVMLRATLLRLDDEHHWAVLTLHHIVADGWSMGILIRETAALYQAFVDGRTSPLPELPIQYTDFAQWQREWMQSERLTSQLDYWKQQLAGSSPLQLPTDRPRSAQTTLAGARLNFTIPKTLSDKVKRLSDREGVTLFMTLLAAFKVLLARYAQQQDIVVGTAIANRHHGETENLIGFFLNILVLRTNVSAELTFHDLLQRVKEVALNAYEHQDVPFDKLVEELQPERQLNRNPFFQVVLAVHSGLAPTLNLHELNVRQLPATSQTSKYDLSIEFVDTDDALTGFLEYSTELFDTSTIERLLTHYQTLLESIVKHPEQSIAHLQLLSQQEQRELLAWNSDGSHPVDQCLHELVAAQVERTPFAPALTFDNQFITYRELDHRANQLAHRLKTLGVGPDVLVSVFMERSMEMMVGLLAVLKAGGAYVPIDPAYPPERIAFILEDTAAPVLLTQQSMASLLPPHSARVVCLDEQREKIEGASVEPLATTVSPDNLAYIIYTSGSTGKPKGVMVTHRNVCRLFAATHDSFAFDQRDVWTLFHSYAFDFSVWEMWGALLYGGRLVIVPYWVSRSPDAFYEMLIRERVTVLNQTPSAFRQLCQIDEVSKREVQHSLALRLVIFGGEALDFESLGQWFRDHGDEQPQLVNMYGITETTVHVTERRVRAADLAANTGSLIGRPISDLRGYVLDQHMELLPAGVPGELYVGGGGVARGYLWRPELSAERFVPDPFSGNSGARLYRTGDLVRYRTEGELEYLGRVDQQVKIRGFRIEPGEIESALEQHEEVREAVVIAREDAGEPRLIAYIVPEQNYVSQNGEQHETVELSAEQVAQWEMVFNENYSQSNSQSDPTFNISGWNNSYTGKPIAEEEMREWLDQTIERILSLQPRKVLEIGCGTGLLLLRLAPFCERYVGTDFSTIALDYIQQTLSLRDEDLPQLELRHASADNFEGIERDSFDLVILNSVVQYFPNIDYLLRVIEGAVRVVRPGGSIFIGDVRNLPLLEAFHLSVQLHQAPASLPVTQLEQRVKRHMAQEEELIIEPAFFAALKHHFPEISDVHALLKQGNYQNEMTQFRYDVVLRVGESGDLSVAAQSSIPGANSVVFQSLKALELLAGEQRPQTVSELRELLQQTDGVDSDSSRLLSFTNGNLKPWARYANNPLEGRFARRLVPKLRSFLQEQLPDYMVPSAFVLMDAMPLTQHGKINRRALPAPEQARPELDDVYIAPRTPVEKELVAMFAHVLSVTQVGLHDNFFDLGGHSLLATQLLARIRETFSDKEITLRHIFESPTVAGLAREIEATGSVEQQLPPLVPIPRDEELPLSFAQQRLWFLDQLEPGKATYNCPAAVRFEGTLNIAALVQSFNEMMRRHEVLRARFSSREGNPVQVIAPSLLVPLPIVDLSGLMTERVEAEIERLSRLEAQRGFDLSRDVLLRTKVLRVSRDEHVVLVTMHHIVSDGWSIGVLVKEVAALYEAYAKGNAAALERPAVQYADYAHWEREWLQGEVLAEQLEYWKEQLAEAPVLELPTDRPRPPVPSYLGAYESFELDQELTGALNDLSRRLDATLFMTLMAAWQTLMHRYSGQSDIVVGTPIANRHQAETEELIGFFVNMLALRADLSRNPTFAELVAQVRETALGAYAHQALPFEKLIEELQPDRDASHAPLVQVVFALQNAPQGDLTALDLKLNYVEVETATAKYDIVVNVYEVDDKLSIVFTYSTDLFAAASMQRLGRHFNALLAAVVENVDERVAEIDFLSTAEREALLVERNATAAVYPVEKSVSELFEEQVRRSPQAIALVYKGIEITYAELQRRAELLAAYLHQHGVGNGSRVGIFLDHSIETVVAILGVLRAGATYVPLDTDHPRARLAFIFEDAQLETVLAQQSLVERLPLNDRLQVILMDGDDWQRVATEGYPYKAGDAAYVIYTSGSTGQPKGVKISQRALVNYLSWCREVYVKNEEASFALYSSLAFDLTVTSIFTPLLTGNRLIIYGRADQFPVYSIVQENLVDVLKLTPSHLALIKDLDNRNSRVKRLIVGGESLSTELAKQVHESFGGQVEILNEYGPTEATVGCMIYRYDPVRDQRQSVPIGRPAANVQIYVLDEHLNPTPENVIGELFISGAGLADGYLNREDLTAQKFISNPFVPGTRMYRSGDRARWLNSGELEYLGRGDEQVKYHGYRIELSEISSALNQHPQVRNSVVLLRPDHRGEDTLMAYYVARREIETAVLREFLLDYLIKETIPNVFIHLTRLPLTLNGKVDYRALPELQESKQRQGEYVAPRTVVEQVVADIWANLLGLPRVSLHDNFFELGGHSLIATQVMVRVQKTTGVELPLRALFENPTVAKLATQIDAALQKDTISAAPPLVAIPRNEELPLSFAQQRLWFLDQLESGTATYNCPAAVRFTGTLNLAALGQSFNEVVRRHEVLRTQFSVCDGSPVQIIVPSLQVPLSLVDLSGLAAKRVEAEIERLSRLEAQRGFDLSHDVLLRTKVLRVSEGEHVVLMTMHHIVSDGWSIGVLVKEVAALYEAYAKGIAPALERPAVQYADYAHWEREWLQGEVLAEQLAYWKQQLAEAPILELPSDHPRPPVPGYLGAYETFELDHELTAGLMSLSRRLDATLFMTLMAAWQTLLHRYSGQRDIVVGTPIANRHQAETEDLIGFFVNMLPLRTDVSGNPTFADLVDRVRETALGAYAHQALPFEKLIEELQPERDTSHTPLVQVVFALQNAPQGDLSTLDLKLNYVEVDTTTAKFDLTLTLQEQGKGLTGRLEYRHDLFEAATIKRLLGHFTNLLHAVVAQPEERIAELPLLSAPERQQLLEEWTDTATVYERESSIHELFEAQVARTPDALAAISNDARLTYKELDQRANQLAWLLHHRGVGPDALVGVSLPRSERLLIALLGILKAGGAYVFLDASYPPERLNLMVQDSAVKVLVTEEYLKAPFSAVDTIICFDTDEAELAAQRSDKLPVTFHGAQQLSYVSYTSGSTGTPKGVAIPHQAVVRLVRETNFARLNAENVFLQLAPISFDASTLELWGPLLNGGRCVLPREQILSAGDLRDAIQSYEINSMWLTSSMFNAIVDEDVTALEGLQQLLVGGEALSVPHIMRAVEQLPETQLINGYGPTENTTFTCCFPIKTDSFASSIPIGPPIANTHVYILDGEMQPAPIGVAGELYIAGDGLARGYINHPELTAEKFVPNPFSRKGGERLYRTGDLTRWNARGEVEFIGRSDRQVKLRGFRIELGEVEAALKRIPEVREAVVDLNRSDASLVAYVVADGLAEEEIRVELQSQLPAYMMPGQVFVLERFPLTRHGKVNLEQLRFLVESMDRGDEGGPPVTEVERTVAEIWGAVLNLKNLGRDANFFQLGGHSLIATQVKVRVQKMTGVELPLRALFENPTVAGLAALIEAELRKDTVSSAPPLVSIPRDEELPLSFAQQRLWFLDQLEPGKATYNCPAAVRFTGALNLQALAQSFNEVVRRHEVLRAHFSSYDGNPVQIVAPSLSMPLPIIDLSGLIRARAEAEIERLSQLEADRGFDLSGDLLLRAKVLRVSEDEHVVLVTMHHIVSDGWSIGVLVKDVAALYEAYAQGSAPALEPLAVQYADYAHWEREWLQGEVLAEQLAYWKEQLAEASVLELPSDRPRPPVPSYRGANVSFELDQELSASLVSLSRRLDATLFMTLLAAWQALLHRYSGQSDIVVGTPIANRHQTETEELIGFFVNMLALRTDVSGNPSFVELVDRVRETALGAYAHQALPFEKLIEELQLERDASHAPLVQVVFVLQNAPQGDLSTLDLKLNYVETDTSTAKFDLVVNVYEIDDKLSIVFRYSTDLFDAASMERLGRHFKALLSEVVENANKRVAEIDFLSPAERRGLLVERNATETVYPAESVVELFAEQVQRSPNAIALVADGTEITYAELQERVELLAAHLHQHGVGAESRVGIFLDHSIETVVAILGVLRAGAAYVPLDTDHPRTRLAFIFEDAQLETVLAQQSLVERLPLSDRLQVILMDGEDWRRVATEGHPYKVGDAAYVIYTSGSTGQPKGVKISHRALVNYVSWCREVYVKNEEVSFALYSSLAFDLTVTSIFTPLVTGNRLIIYGRSDRFPVQSIVQDNLVNVLKLTPSHLALIKDFDNRNSRIKRLIVGGESLSTELAAQVHESFGGQVEILNEYGPTEATVGCMIYRYDPARDQRQAVPIGRPAANVQIYVLDEHLNPTPENVIGELFISGAGLADGYVNRPELTAQKFISNPFVPGTNMYRSGDRARWLPSGELEYLGRGDEQVKYHGYRIELSEISNALNQHPQVRNSVVLLRKDHRGEDTLVAYYVARREIETAVLREFLLDYLIKETIPNVFIHLTRLPLTLNGKVDYRALPELQESKQRQGEYVAPRTVVEEVVADIWASLLGLSKISLHDNFFELGGHSLIATQVMVRVQKTTGVELPLRALFENPTVAQLAAQIEAALRKGTASPAPPIVPVARDGELPLSFAQQRLWFLDQLEPGKATYNCPAAMRLTGNLNLPALHQSLNEIVRRHEVLRTNFADVDGQPVPGVMNTSALCLNVVDLQMVEPDRREQQILRLARAEADRPFDLSQPPPLLRVTLVRLDQHEQVALFTMHHIICDAWSIAILRKEVMRLYEVYSRGTPSPLAELEIQYSDYATWQRQWLQGEALEEKLTAWERQFGEDPPLLELPEDEWRNEGTPSRSARQQLVLSRELSQALRVLGQRESATLFMTMLAAFECLLHRYTEQVDMVVGTGVANRNRREIEDLIGFFVNMLVMRTDLSGNPTFKQMLARVREATLAAFAFEDLPFEKLVETLHPDRNVAGTSLLRLAFWHQNVPMDSFSLEGLTFTPLQLNNEMIYFDLMAEIIEGEEGLTIRLSYNTNQFQPETIARLLTNYEALLQSVVEQPEIRLLDTPVQTKEKLQSSSFSLHA